MEPEQNKVRRILDILAKNYPQLLKGSRVFVASAPFQTDDWTPALLVRLYYRDESLDVAWSSSLTPPPDRPGPFDVTIIVDPPPPR